MIQVKEKQDCCGCGACEQICPLHAISMKEDSEGFLYPATDTSLCIECGLCNKVCPVLNRFKEPNEKPLSYACKSYDESIIDKSSSGGFFTVLAEYVLDNEGVVFGVQFDDNWEVNYSYTETKEGLEKFRGSKYVQGAIGATYIAVRNFLKTGRLVLFTGTPCHVSGLNHFLRHSYCNLITLDFVCHSIPSPMVWRDYLNCLQTEGPISHVTFRDKSLGWDNYGIRIEVTKDDKIQAIVRETHKNNIYFKAFLTNLTARPSCFFCPARRYTSGSDIMIADCWGFNKYHPEINNNKGMSLVLPKTNKGLDIFEKIKKALFVLQIPYEEVEEETNHKPLLYSATPNHYRNQFFKIYSSKNVIRNMEFFVQKGEARKRRILMIKSFICKILKPFKR